MVRAVNGEWAFCVHTTVRNAKVQGVGIAVSQVGSTFQLMYCFIFILFFFFQLKTSCFTSVNTFDTDSVSYLKLQYFNFDMTYHSVHIFFCRKLCSSWKKNKKIPKQVVVVWAFLTGQKNLFSKPKISAPGKVRDGSLYWPDNPVKHLQLVHIF